MSSIGSPNPNLVLAPKHCRSRSSCTPSVRTRVTNWGAYSYGIQGPLASTGQWWRWRHGDAAQADAKRWRRPIIAKVQHLEEAPEAHFV
eukprot:6414297-Prymnesium_polylepis.1